MQLRAAARSRRFRDGAATRATRRRVPVGVLVACVAAVHLGGLRRADAEGNQAASRVTLFREPSSSNAGITVVHPQVEAKAALGTTVGINANYDVDIVSGATPKVFGARRAATGLDAVTSASKFEDIRHETRGGISFNRPVADVSVSYGYGWEKDYRSHTVTASTRSDVLDRNLTLGVGYTHNWDRVCDANNSAAEAQPVERKALGTSEHCFQSDKPDVVTRHLTIDSLETSLTWTVTPRLLLQGGLSLQILDGFQANPYRSVIIGQQGRMAQESLPQTRERLAGFLRFAYAFPEARTSVGGMARLYRDTWDVRAATAELTWNKYFGKLFLFGLRGRFHQQEGAAFYRTAEDYATQGAPGTYWTGDRELSPMKSALGGVKATILVVPEHAKSWYDEFDFELKWDTLVYILPEGAPNADRTHAFIWQLAGTLSF